MQDMLVTTAKLQKRILFKSGWIGSSHLPDIVCGYMNWSVVIKHPIVYAQYQGGLTEKPWLRKFMYHLVQDMRKVVCNYNDCKNEVRGGE